LSVKGLTLPSSFAEFVGLLLREGCASLKSPPERSAAADGEVVTLLQQAHHNYCLSLAGPPVDFDGRTALAAAALVHCACWLVLDRSVPVDAMEQLLQMPKLPATPAEHAAADLMFRYLPQLHRRAAALDAAEPLTATLARVLRQWPLSGVLSDVTEEPLTPPDFGEHSGLWWLYTERWAQRQKSAWQPTGPGAEYLEAVWIDLGRDISLLRRPEKVAISTGEGEV
jgi:hypothetical protein